MNSSAAIPSMVPPLQSPTVPEGIERFAAAAAAGRGLLLFGGVLAAAPGQLMLALVEALGQGDTCQARELYGRLFAALAAETELGTRPPGDAWAAHLLDRMLADENPFSRKCEISGA